MTIQEAYDKWSEEKDVKTFAIKSRQFWNRAWKKLDMNIPCSEAKMPVLLMALQAVSLDKETVVKASSVMVYVLKYAHAQDYKVNPLPAFEYSDILHQWEGSPTEDESKVKAGRKFRESVPKLTESVPKLPKNDPKLTENVPELPKSVEKLPKPKKQVVKKSGQKVVKKTAKKSKDESKKAKTPQKGNIRLTKDGKRYNPSRERRQIAQIDPSTMEVIKVEPSPTVARQVVTTGATLATSTPSNPQSRTRIPSSVTNPSPSAKMWSLSLLLPNQRKRKRQPTAYTLETYRNKTLHSLTVPTKRSSTN